MAPVFIPARELLRCGHAHVCTCTRVCVETGRNSEVKKQGARWQKESERRENLRWGDREIEGAIWWCQILAAACEIFSCGV